VQAEDKPTNKKNPHKTKRLGSVVGYLVARESKNVSLLYATKDGERGGEKKGRRCDFICTQSPKTSTEPLRRGRKGERSRKGLPSLKKAAEYSRNKSCHFLVEGGSTETFRLFQ